MKYFIEFILFICIMSIVYFYVLDFGYILTESATPWVINVINLFMFIAVFAFIKVIGIPFYHSVIRH